MKRIYAGNLPATTTELQLTELFSEFGRVRSVKLPMEVFSGKCRGFAFVEMEGHEARAAIVGLNGREFGGQLIRVNEERQPDARRGGRR